MITQGCALAIIQLSNILKQKSSNISREVAGAIEDGETGAVLEYQHLSKHPKYKETWKHSYVNEIGRLVQGIPGQVNGTNTLFFMKKDEVPDKRFRHVTKGQIICDYWEGKAEPNRTRFTIERDKINYPGDCGTPTADLLTVKLLLNSVVSTPNAMFMTMDIKFFHLNNPLKQYEYLRLKIDNIPEDVQLQYKL